MEEDFINFVSTNIKDGFNYLIGRKTEYKKDTKDYLDNEINKFFKRKKDLNVTNYFYIMILIEK